MLVIDEALDMWREPKNPQDYGPYFDDWWQKDLESMILRDRNHPSIIMWSTGNEIPNRHTPEVAQLSQKLSDFVHALDPTRPVTAAVNSISPDKDPYFATLDVCGYNYAPGTYRSEHERIPDRIIYGSESFPLRAFEAWMGVVDFPWVIGDFVWTGFDYLGESSIGWLGYPHRANFYPWHHAFCGDIDICGWKRPQSFYRDVLWENGKMISLFVKTPEPSFESPEGRADWSVWHWNDVVSNWNWEGHEGKPLEVEVYSRYPQTELFLNGVSLGKSETTRDTRWMARWKVPFEPGMLKAVGYDSGEKVGGAELRTAGKPDQIKLIPDRSQMRSDGQDLSFVTVEVQDTNGIRHPGAEPLIEFGLEGPGSIAAVANSNPKSKESFQRPSRTAYQGRCLVIIRSARGKGTLQLTASAQGLRSASVSLAVN
jgi:beta-galactosidase